ncbi:MAG TPA: hypothetical protein VFB38_09260 [Chthonomonadaceae bacterium]|nr:hypothetical protein [Chthonomonadaceae bacterium]
MAPPQVIEGTGEELQRHLAQFPNERFLLVPLSSSGVDTAQEKTQEAELSPVAEGEILADFLGDFIGCIQGSGANNSENTGQKFTEYLVKKHKEGHL